MLASDHGSADVCIKKACKHILLFRQSIILGNYKVALDLFFFAINRHIYLHIYG